MKNGLESMVTFLAPIDKAFVDIGQESMDNLLNDKSLADEVIRSHILKGNFQFCIILK